MTVGWSGSTGSRCSARLSVVAVARQPVDVGLSTADDRRFLTRLAMAVNGRFSPWRGHHGLVVGLTAQVLTPEPIGRGDVVVLGTVLGRLPWMRAVPFGVIRANPGQEAIAFALTASPDALFPEPVHLADADAPVPPVRPATKISRRAPPFRAGDLRRPRCVGNNQHP